MKKLILYIILAFLLAGCNNSSRLPDMRESYSYKSTKPFGTYIAKEMIEQSYPDNKTVISKDPFIEDFAESKDTNSVYFCISRNLYLTDPEAQAMLDYVYMGNTVFISAANIDTSLLTRIHTIQEKNDWIFNLFQGFYFTAKTKLVEALSGTKDSFNYFYKPFSNYFSSIRANNASITGYNADNRPNSFLLPWGKGKLMVHCDPRAFSNYFLLKHENNLYLENLLQLTPDDPDHIYWDDHYRTLNTRSEEKGNFSAFSEIMKHPPLATALWIFIAMLLLYVLFNSKRKQRIIPVIPRNSNSSVAFTETIARLYLQQKDNKNITEKMITYFNEYIRNKYFLIATNNNDFISALSRKSGVGQEQTNALFRLMNDLENKEEISDQELLSLNHHIQQFYKHRN
jgi:hypothetical protein